MQKRRTKAQWLVLIDEFEQSGLIQAEFCAQRGLDAKYFSLRRIKLKARPETGGFVQAVTNGPDLSDPITLHFGAVTLKVPATNVQAVVQLVKALAA